MAAVDIAPVGATLATERSRREVNAQLLQSLVSAFAQDPETDFATLLPSDYKSHFPRRRALDGQESESRLAQLNRRTIDALLQQFAKEPEASLTQATCYPSMYGVQRRKAQGKSAPAPEIEQFIPPPKHFASALDEVTTTSYDIVSPLSTEVQELLQQKSLNGTQDPVRTLKDVIQNSILLWSDEFGRFVAKLSDNVAVKADGRDPINHCAAYKFLAEHVPGIPAPRPHGLIEVDGHSLMFFSYVPGVTLEKAWPTLLQQQKRSIQTQLDCILAQIRAIPRDGRPLGMVSGAGVVDERGWSDDFQSDKTLHTVAEFEEFVFSYRPWVTETYVRFLQQLLPESRFDEPCVFTHCDLRPTNIMVDPNENGEWKVTGIIDWEEAGFYPEYWESVKATRTFLANKESDWWLMLPSSISPSRYSTNWLVDRLWESMIKVLGDIDKHRKKAKETPQQK